MVVRDVVEELLGVERTTEEEGEVPVGGFDDVGDLVDGVATVEGVGVDEAVLDALAEGNARLEGFGDAGEEGWVYDGGAMGDDGGGGEGRSG